MKSVEKFSSKPTHPKSITQWPKIGYMIVHIISLKTFREIIFTKFFVKVISRKNKVKTNSITISWVAPLFNAILTHKCADKWREIVNFCYSSKMHKSVFKTFFFSDEMTHYTFISSIITILTFSLRRIHGML